MRAVLLLAVVSIVVFGGCSSKKEAGEAPPEAMPTEEAVSAPKERTITLTPTRTQPDQKPAPIRVVNQSRPVMQRDEILSLRGGGIYGPEDFEIGELQGYSEDRNIRDILERIRSFQKGLESATVPLADIHPDWKNQAQRSLGFYLDRGNIPTDIRVGAIEIFAPGLARANIRMSGDPGVALGEIYLRQMDDLWLVDDVQLDLGDLSEIPEKRQEPYEPSVFRMTDMP